MLASFLSWKPALLSWWLAARILLLAARPQKPQLLPMTVLIRQLMKIPESFRHFPEMSGISRNAQLDLVFLPGNNNLQISNISGKFSKLLRISRTRERRSFERTAVPGKNLSADRAYLGGNFSLLGVSLAFEIVLFTNDL